MILEPETIAGASGWASFGITGAILGWLLLKHLPAKDAQIKDLVELFIARDDRRASEQLQWRSTVVEEMGKDRHDLRDVIGTVIVKIDSVEEHLRDEIQKRGGWVKPAVLGVLVFFGFLILGFAHCNVDARSPAQRKFDYACAHYEAHR